jgi:hypothetical protein
MHDRLFLGVTGLATDVMVSYHLDLYELRRKCFNLFNLYNDIWFQILCNTRFHPFHISMYICTIYIYQTDFVTAFKISNESLQAPRGPRNETKSVQCIVNLHFI